MAFNSNNDPFSPRGDDTRPTLSSAPLSPSPAPPSPVADAPAPAMSDNPQSAAFVRFGSCRWQQPAENGNTAFCTHREVKPYAGTTGFDADAWCPECQYYKLRRAPKKRDKSEDYSY